MTAKFDPIAFFSPHTVGGKPKKGTHSTACVYIDGSSYTSECVGCMHCIASYYCAGMMRSKKDQPVKIKELYSSLWTHDYTNLHEYSAYWNFCLSKERSPWKSVLKDSEIIHSKDGVPIAYVLRDMDQPFQVIANLMFAIRMAFAQEGYLRSFTKFVEAGFTEHEALFITANIGVDRDDKVFIGYVGDYPFDTAWYDMHWPNFKESTPQANKKIKINFGSSYSPCNSIWSKDGTRPGVSNYDAGERKGTIIQQMVTGEFKYKGKFNKSFSTLAKDLPKEGISFEVAAKILKDRKDEWQAFEGFSSSGK